MTTSRQPPTALPVPSRWRDPSERTLAALLLAPAFMLLALIVVYPIGRLVWNSFFDLRLSGGTGGGARFVGIENYVLVWQDRDFWTATRNTLLITLITVPGALVAGLGLALLANLPFKRRWPREAAGPTSKRCSKFPSRALESGTPRKCGAKLKIMRRAFWATWCAGSIRVLVVPKCLTSTMSG